LNTVNSHKTGVEFLGSGQMAAQGSKTLIY